MPQDRRTKQRTTRMFRSDSERFPKSVRCIVRAPTGILVIAPRGLTGARDEQQVRTCEVRKGEGRMPARKKEPQAQRQYYTIQEVCTMLNLSRSKVHDLIENEQLPVEKFGAALRV